MVELPERLRLGAGDGEDFLSVVLVVGGAAVGSANALLMLTPPVVAIANEDFPDGLALVLSFFERNGQELRAVGAGDATAVSPSAFLVVFMPFNLPCTCVPRPNKPMCGREIGGRGEEGKLFFHNNKGAAALGGQK